MIYDRLQVALLSTLLSEKAGSPYALIAQYLLAHAGLPDALSVKAVAQVCHVGTGNRVALCQGRRLCQLRRPLCRLRGDAREL